MTIIATADGSALGNPGPAGWAWYIDDGTWRAGGWPHGTNNMGELKAVLDLLESTADRSDEPLRILCDSQYVINSVTKWMPGWKRKGWKKKDGKAVLNVDLLKGIDAALAGREVRFEWVKGHAGHDMNEAADKRARAAATAYQRGQEPDRGPGLGPARDGGALSESALPSTAVSERAAARPAADPDDQLDLFSTFDADACFTGPDPSPADQCVALEKALLSDAVRADAGRVEELLAEGFAEIGASGTLWTRDAMLSSIAPLEGVEADGFLAREVAPRVVLLTYDTNSATRGTVHRSSLWVQEEGSAEVGPWRLRFHQGTPAD